MAEWLGKGLQNPVPRFDSGCRLLEEAKGPLRAISSGGERFLDAEEVSGSNPLSPTLINLLFAGESKSKGEGPGEYAGPSCSNAGPYFLLRSVTAWRPLESFSVRLLHELCFTLSRLLRDRHVAFSWLSCGL